MYTIEPKKLFLIDSLGALLSAITLGLILTKFEDIFGMPRRELYALSGIACMLAFYSFLCFKKKFGNRAYSLKIIALANLLYCCLTLGLIIHLYQKLTVFGFTYFILEILIVAILASAELKTAANYQISHKNR